MPERQTSLEEFEQKKESSEKFDNIAEEERKIIEDHELEEYLIERWKAVSKLSNRRILIKRNLVRECQE